ncbi:Aldo/keto reductase [Tuber magnatum]|uniref:Aldo/keto reductase n=1 Tax=Tuber magnatum TaxID=42249 RepID=A0A317SSF6_9PEZI|nr:Aldo/keto reductase [Tuber magnatum]
MEYARLGNSELKVSKIILGALSFGDPKWAAWIKNEQKSLPLLKAAFDLGINTWDTADIKPVILSKCFFTLNEDDPWDQRWVNMNGLSRKHIFNTVDASVERLGTYIDVLQIHRLDRDTPMEEIMCALHNIVLSGKEFQMLQNIAEKNGWTKCISVQNCYNLRYREEVREMIPYCKATGVGITPWSPLARSALARPYEEATVRAIEEVANKHGVSMAIVATAWTLWKGAYPILGPNSVERMREAVKSLRVELDEEDSKKLEEKYVPKEVRGY